MHVTQIGTRDTRTEEEEGQKWVKAHSLELFVPRPAIEMLVTPLSADLWGFSVPSPAATCMLWASAG